MNLPRVARSYFSHILQKRANNVSFDLVNVEENLGKAKVGSILVVHDKNVRSVPFESAERIVERWEQVNLIVTQGMGHLKVMKNPKVVEMVVDFIAEGGR